MSKVKIEIKSWLNGSVLFEYESEDATLRKALEAAIADDADLSGANLRDADLRDADLRGADLSGADLSGADLRDADLSGANLRDADLRDADLRGADLRGADLSGADLRDADLSGADLRDATIHYSDENFDAERRKNRFIRNTQLDEVETEMLHDIPSISGRWVTWKNVLKIKSWKLNTTEDITPEAEEMTSETVAQTSETIAADSKCDQGGSEVDSQSGDIVAFKYGEALSAGHGKVIAVKGDELVITPPAGSHQHDIYIINSSDVYLIKKAQDEEKKPATKQ